ncbi:MAG: ABC transporter ATP-binding protein [Alicyclobacillus sp.]|nr:ABC transporter ATP-binding protein [Alicyclobacillus sp.]
MWENNSLAKRSDLNDLKKDRTSIGHVSTVFNDTSSYKYQAGSGGIRLEGVSKWFYRSQGEKVVALSQIDLEIPKGAFVSLVGPSGCGKSTILNCIAGFQYPDAGKVIFEGKEIRGLNVGIGYMTQKDYLLPWRDVLDNVWLPLQARGIPTKEGKQRALEYIKRVGLEGFEHNFPRELSGGMLKRAAMARTLVFHPSTLLMDEPFGNLDAQLKLQLQRELLRIWHQEKQTVIFVTHDLEEAIALSDMVVVLSGRPSSVKQVIHVDLPRPRDPISIRFEPEFQRLHKELWSLIDVTLEVDHEFH